MAKMTKMVRNGKNDQNWSKIAKMTKMVKIGKNDVKMVTKMAKMIENGQKWQK